jgi:hypothetical protein
MSDAPIRWTVNVGVGTDARLRSYLAERGTKKGAFSKFIEEAVKWRLLDLTIAEARSGFEDMDEDELAVLLDEAVSAARRH